MGKIPIVKNMMKISSLLKPISIIDIAKYKILKNNFYIITHKLQYLKIFINFLYINL